ncbi:MAG: DUF4037 domain-containing protein [Spirochaetaceae bacterium]|jgi:hypothetical protein|nr:DUF4037 domain-containing protein [Spirochaetaceae bacterium]
MKYKTKKLSDRFVSVLSQWPQVECISLNEAADSDTLNPYFALILDVYHNGEVPPPEKRWAIYGSDAAAFETSHQGNKDRFLVGSLPVRLEFKSTGKIEELVSIAESKHDSLWLIKDSGTYGYYRLAQGDILFSRTGWVKDIRKRLLGLDDDFWIQMRDASQSRMEHYLSDLGAALINDDEFHYLISSALFIKSACLALFCINRRFEPSHKAYYRQVVELPVLPESFAAELETFLRESGELTLERKYKIAQLVARNIIAL